MDVNQIYRLVDERRRELGLTQTQVSERAFGRTDTAAIQNLRRGKVPAADKLAAIAEALGLEFYIGAPRESASNAALSGTPLKVRGIAACSIYGWGEPSPEQDPIAAPTGWTDETAFWAIATGASMRPEGIPENALCLISPAADPAPGDRVWIREARTNRTAIKRFVKAREDGWIEIMGWLPPQDGKQQSYNEKRKLSSLDELFVVKGVWRGRPGDPTGVEFIPDPRSLTPEAEPEVEMSSVRLMAAELSGGAGALADDIALDHISFPTRWFRQHSVNPRNATLHRVRGKSMEPTIREGAIVLLDHDRTDPSIEGIYAFHSRDEGLRVKRLHRLGDNLIIMSDNRSEEYPTELLVREELNELRVLGRVAAVIAEF